MNTDSRSRIFEKLCTRENSISVCVKVPNSLGPSKLLLKYGTDEQKNKYLPKLADGTYIPCFGLTSAQAGSDAAGSMVDYGRVVKGSNGELGIEITCSKRYITLAPVSNLIGLAFKLYDPDNLLSEGNEGITLALIDKTLDKDNRIEVRCHDPLGCAFPNGTITMNKYFIPIDNIIGGQQMAGNGWKMIMEGLAEGRSVSLPSCAIASMKLSLLGVSTYSRYRKQFKIPISKMEAIQEKLADMTIQTYIINSGIRLTNAMLDNNERSSVIGAIMKQQSTERAFNVIKHGMDIVGGSGISRGINNYMASSYQYAPIGITVEGSNTLTRSLIIFGQGLMRSHPHLFKLVESIEHDDHVEFNNNLKGLISHTFKNIGRSLYRGATIPMLRLQGETVTGRYEKDLSRLSSNFAVLSNSMLMLGSKFKKAEMLSGRMADIFSNLYLGYASLWYFQKYGSSDHLPIMKLSLETILYNIQESIDEVLINYPNRFTAFILRRIIFFPLGNKTFNKPNDNSKVKVSNMVTTNNEFRNDIMKGVYIPKDNTNLSLMLDNWNMLLQDENSDHINNIRNLIIQVDSYDN
jgi:acyl-CoA dehydrogenase